jgi:hypothetical protein
MIVFSSVWGTGRTLSSSLFLMTVLSPSPSRSRLMIVVSSAFTVVVIGAATSVAAMQVEDMLAHRSVSNELRLIQNLEELQMFHLQTLRSIVFSCWPKGTKCTSDRNPYHSYAFLNVLRFRSLSCRFRRLS